MNYKIIGKTGKSPKIAILCPRIQIDQIEKYYYNPYLAKLNKDVIICDLYIDKTKKKTSASDIKEYLNDLLPELIDMSIELLIITQPEYFKIITKKLKTDNTIGDIIKTVVPNLYGTYCPNYSRIFYDPDNIKNKIKLSLESSIRWMSGDHTSIGNNIIKYSAYPKTESEIKYWLNRLINMNCDLTCDIEGFSLKHYNCGIGTITFCWNKHEGIAFPVDYVTDFLKTSENKNIRKMLREFFENFQHKIIYHNICFDVYILIYQLFMDHILDQKGLLKGLDIMLRNWDCTQLITYLATNSCAGNKLSLKAQSQEFAGNYAQEDINDITKIPVDTLLKYNLTDGLATWFVYEKNKPIMIKDKQENIYKKIFKPAVKDVIQMQLTGMPLNMKKVKILNNKLNKESENLLNNMNNTSLVKNFIEILKDELVIKKNKKLKTKQITKKDLGKTKDTQISFNPNSPIQLQRLLYSEDFLGLPILDCTDTKAPSTEADTLEKLLHQTKDKNTLKFLNYLIKYKALAIILSTFLPAFLQAQKGEDNWHYLFGNFRLGGTKSGRISSNNPNLQNIPSSGSTLEKQRLAKMIKECFEAPFGWLFVGIDFDSLEDKISAVTTKDPNKIKVYSDGYDGHCLRAYAYFSKNMQNIELAPKNTKTYKAITSKGEFLFHDKESIEYLGKNITGKELFELLKDK